MNPHIVVIDDEQDIRELLRDILEDEGFIVSLAANGTEARHLIQSFIDKAMRPDLILLDIWMPDVDGISLLKEWKNAASGILCPVVMMSGHGTVEHAVEATRFGAYDFLEKPLTLAKLLLIVNRALESAQLTQENVGLKRKFERSFEPIGNSHIMNQLKNDLLKVIGFDQTPILLIGELGVGKQNYARYIHCKSARKNKPFISINAAAILRENASAELFGVEDSDNKNTALGLFEQANQGILYLNDITEMDLDVQTKLASTLETGHFFRIGGKTAIPIDVRIIASSQQELMPKVKAGLFKENLFYRLNIAPIEIPPLRDHAEDVPALLMHYVDYFLEEEGLNYRKFSMSSQNRLRNHDWLGNVSELKNLVQRLMIFGEREDITNDEVEQILYSTHHTNQRKNATNNLFLELPLKEAREQFERHYLQAQFKNLDGNIAKLADKVGMERTNLYRKLKSLHIDFKEKN